MPIRTRSKTKIAEDQWQARATNARRIRYVAATLLLTEAEVAREIIRPHKLLAEFDVCVEIAISLLYFLKLIFDQELWLPPTFVDVVQKCLYHPSPRMKEIRDKRHIHDFINSILEFNRCVEGRLHVVLPNDATPEPQTPE